MFGLNSESISRIKSCIHVKCKSVVQLDPCIFCKSNTQARQTTQFRLILLARHACSPQRVNFFGRCAVLPGSSCVRFSHASRSAAASVIAAALIYTNLFRDIAYTITLANLTMVVGFFTPLKLPNSRSSIKYNRPIDASKPAPN